MTNDKREGKPIPATMAINASGESGNKDAEGNDWGGGLCYSLALFLAHQAHFPYVVAEVEMLAAEGALQFEGKASSNPKNVKQTIGRLAATRWFSAAALPIRGLQIPDHLSGELRHRLHRFKDKTLKWMFPANQRQPSADDVWWAVNEAKELIRAIDEHRGVRTVKETTRFTGIAEPILRFCDND